MRAGWFVSFAALAASTVASGAALAQADNWYPSPWGPADQRGAANRITPQKVLDRMKAFGD